VEGYTPEHVTFFLMLKKISAMAIAIVAAITLTTHVYASGPNEHDSSASHASSRPDAQTWYSTFERPDGMLVIVGLATFMVIGWQSLETRKAASAARDAATAALIQANHVATSERAWMVASIEGEVIPDSTGVRILCFSVRYVNKGKTPAFLLEIKHNGVVLPREQELPDTRLPWDKFNVEVWEQGVPLQPGDFLLKQNLNTLAPDVQRLHQGRDWLWVYGEIKYRDAFGNERETCYCFIWDCVHDIPGIGRETHFLVKGPDSYIRAT
jgi:hypothetical protein